jgi:ribonuclease T2
VRLGPAIVAFLLAVLPAAASAQAISCRVPDRLPAASPEPRGVARIVPVGGYTLALSWSPEYCRLKRDSATDKLQCGGATGRFGFVLHGLWPDGRGDQWPEYCRDAQPVPEPVLRATLCAMPSVQLQQHEWAKHGVCAFPNPAAYFRAARLLHAAVRYPDMDALSRNRNLHVAGFATAFAARNPGVRADMLRVQRNPRGWLEQVLLCLDVRFRPTVCRDGGAARDTRPLRIWRSVR